MTDEESVTITLVSTHDLMTLVEDCIRWDTHADEPCDGCSFYQIGKTDTNPQCNFDREKFVDEIIKRCHKIQDQLDKWYDHCKEKYGKFPNAVATRNKFIELHFKEMGITIEQKG